MAVQVHGQGHGIHVAGALAIAEQAALHALGTCQHRQLGAGHAGAAVIVGVGGEMCIRDRPSAPEVRGIMVIFCTGAEWFCRAATRAWPISW